MDNAAYVALSRELALFRDMDVTAGNIANANTQGFNADHIMFNSYITGDGGMSNGVKNSVSFPNPVETYRDTTNGGLTSTGNALDVALQGPGYFIVQTPLGTRYTRAGSFQIDGDGNVVTADGYKVLDNNGQPIEVPEDTRDIKIGSAGNLQANGSELAILGIVQFANPQLLERTAAGLYKTDATPITDVQDVTVAQGMVESSNVQPVSELTHMMNLSHDVADNAKFIEVLYDLQRKTSDTWTAQTQ